MNHRYKLRQRITAMCLAAMMCCSMFPLAAFAEENPTPTDVGSTVVMEQQTDETEADSGQSDESSPDPGSEADTEDTQPTEETADSTTEFEAAESNADTTEETSDTTPVDETKNADAPDIPGSELYTDLPDSPTGSYMGSKGLPVAIGETKIGISEWSKSQLEEDSSGYLTAEVLNCDNLSMAAPLLEGEEYAIVPILAEVEYPADNSSTDIVLPDNVTLLDFYGNPAEDSSNLLHDEYSEISAAAMGIYVQADTDFSAQFVYTTPDGSTQTKTLNVTIDRSSTVPYPFADSNIATYAGRPVPDVMTGFITKVQKVIDSWLIWFNGVESYCCTHGAKGQPKGCPPYNYANTSAVSADQYVPGDHYGNQIRIWGGLNQLSLGFLEDRPVVFSLDDPEEISLLDFCRTIYDDEQLHIIEAYPDSIAAKIYLESAQEILNGTDTYAAARGYYTFIYYPTLSDWQTVAVIGPEISDDEPNPEPVEQEYYAGWEAPAQTASGSFDWSYGVTTDKIQLRTAEKVDDATIEIEPITKSGSIDGGSWNISPAGKQTVTTGGHTQDDTYQNHGGAASASWNLHYAVTKTTGSKSGRVGPYTTQEAADSAADSARDSAINELKAEAQSMVDRAIASAKAELAQIKFRYQEISKPYGFEMYWGSNGSNQTISVPANTNNAYVMKNDEWSLQVNLKKTDSETGNQIAADAQYEVFQWDTVTGKYRPTGGYNTYSVQRQGDGTYAVINSAAYATTDSMRHTLYYTQRNEGKFVIVETKAPTGYFGDWTDIDHPGTAGTPLGKRGYYIEITAANDNAVIWLDNADYSADISTVDQGGTKLVTADGVETTIHIYKASEAPAAEIQYKDASRTYSADNSGKAANEDSYSVQPTDGVMKNSRTLGEISISKVDLDAIRYVAGKAAHGTALASGQAHGDATLDGAVYDLYAAEDITHPDGVTGIVDYSKIVGADGSPIWHTTIRDNSGQWVADYLPILKKDHLVASAKIEDGWLTFSNLYLGKYYAVERSTGTVIPLSEGAYVVSGTYPTVDRRTKAATGQTAALAANGGQYTDWVYKNQFSTISKGKALDSSWTYDAYYLSFANGYLCDEHNYYITPAYSDEGWYVEKTAFADNRQAAGEQIDKTSYSANYHIHADNTLTESQDQVAKGNVEISKVVSSSGQSNGLELENAGFTFYLVSDLSKVDQFSQMRSGSYILQNILDAYINPNYDNEHQKWDFSAETQAIAKTYEVNAAEIAAYNKTLTAAGENKNGKGLGWQPTGNANEYQLAEIFSNDSGNIRVQGLPYGTYLVVETTTPHDLFQAEPFLVSIDPEQDNNPWGAMATPKGSVMTGSNAYQKYTVLDEEIEVYLKITKIDEETGKPVLLPDTAFQIYWLDENGHYRYDKQGNPKLVTMTDTVNGHLTKDVSTFYTNSEGILTLPEKLPLGKYRIVEVSGPNGFYNEWLDSAGYENGILADDSDGSYYVDFTITTDRIYQATGDKNENGMDTLVIGEKYSNHETLGKLTIRKTGEALTGWKAENNALDPVMTGEAEDGDFVYTTRPLAGAEYTITAAEDIYTQDRQLDNYGNRTLWYSKGDVVAVVTTGDGTADTTVFAPARTKATYDFLSVIHDGTVGEVSVTLPLGSYHIEETKPPYGYLGTPDSYDVTLIWDNELNDIVMAQSISKFDGAASEQTFDVVRSKDANSDFIESLVLKYYNEREKARVGVYKIDRETGKYLAGAVFNLYTADDIYDADGKLLFRAGELVATSPVTNADGYTYFATDIPIRGEYYGQSSHKDATTNSGNYIVKELRAPLGYYVNEEPMEVTFTYDGEALMVLDNTCANKPTEMWVSKRDLTNDEELPGATLVIKDKKGNTVTSWVSEDEPHRVTGLQFGEPYTLTEIRPADGYAVADDIVFRLIQAVDENGNNLDEAEVYYLTTKNFLFWKWDDWALLDNATVIMRDDITKVQISKVDIATGKELPGAELIIRNKDGKEVDLWTSTDKPHYIEKLPAGDYTLTEITAPSGYQIAETIRFTVQPTGEIQSVVMKDARIPDETPTPEHTPQPTPSSTPAPAPTPTSTPAPQPVIPQTGDDSPLGLMLVLAGISLAGLAFLIYKKHSRKDMVPFDEENNDTEE